MSDNKKMPRVLRHNDSGVWFCYILGPSKDYPEAIEIEGRRQWSWTEEHAIDTSDLAARGHDPDGTLTSWVRDSVPIDGIVDCYHTTEEILEACRNAPPSTRTE